MLCSLLFPLAFAHGILFPFVFCNFDHEHISLEFTDGKFLKAFLKLGTFRTDLHLFLLGV